MDTFMKGVGDANIITMCMIYPFVGAFSTVVKAMGGVEPTVNFGLSVIPPSQVLPGIFLIGAFISTTMGTSIGTIAAVVPIAVAVVMSGPMAKDIATENGVDPRRSASILDIFSCVWQGLVPYGAQLLLAGSIAKVSPIQIMPGLYYQYLLGAAVILAIVFGIPKTPTKSAAVNT
jgi:Na+/H+ antiporter NhaC